MHLRRLDSLHAAPMQLVSARAVGVSHFASPGFPTVDRAHQTRNPQIVRTGDFAFDLPPSLIAQQPAEPRDASRLMLLRRAAQSIEHHRFRDLPELLGPGDLLVVNDTRVMAARLFGHRAGTGGRAEALLVRPLTDLRWEALFRPARAALPGRSFIFEAADGELPATIVERRKDLIVLDFARQFDPANVGQIPLPPYIHHFHGDPERYQTVFSRQPASAAAPTAGLHFTEELFHRLARAGIDHTAITLEVGPGTFKPVTADDPHDHELHAEHIAVPQAAVDAIARTHACNGRVVSVGTTVVRTLEHVVRERGKLEAYRGWTSLRILPGDEFQATEVLLTNFHLPRSTLLMLVCAFAGTAFVLDAYREAVASGYRFYSFGDAMLILP